MCEAIVFNSVYILESQSWGDRGKALKRFLKVPISEILISLIILNNLFIPCFTEHLKVSSPFLWGFPGGASGKEPACQFRRQQRFEFDPRLRKIPGGGNGSPLQYSCVENPMERGACWATVHRVAKSQTWLSGQVCTHRVIFSKGKINRLFRRILIKRVGKNMRIIMDSQWVDCSSTSRNGTKNENWDIKTEKTHSSYVSIWPKASEGIGIPGNGP